MRVLSHKLRVKYRQSAHTQTPHKLSHTHTHTRTHTHSHHHSYTNMQIRRYMHTLLTHLTHLKCTHTHAHIYTQAREHTHIQLHTNMYSHACKQSFRHLTHNTHVYTQTHINICVFSNIHKDACTRIHTTS